MTFILGDCRDYTAKLEYDYVFCSPPDYSEIDFDTNDRVAYQNFLSECFEHIVKKKIPITFALTDRKHNGGISSKSNIIMNLMRYFDYALASHKIWMKSEKMDLFRLTYANVMTFAIADKDGNPASSFKVNMEYKPFKPDVWQIDKDAYQGYSLGVPVELVERCISAHTKMDQMVYDPFMGSGSTAVAAIKCHRKYAGTELDETIFKLSQQRLAEVQSKS